MKHDRGGAAVAVRAAQLRWILVRFGRLVAQGPPFERAVNFSRETQHRLAATMFTMTGVRRGLRKLLHDRADLVQRKPNVGPPRWLLDEDRIFQRGGARRSGAERQPVFVPLLAKFARGALCASHAP